MSEPEYVLVSESVDEVPVTIGTSPKRVGRGRALEFALVPFDALRRRRRRLVMAALLVLGAAGIAAAIVAVRRRHNAQVRHDDSLGLPEDPAANFELLAHAAAD